MIATCLAAPLMVAMSYAESLLLAAHEPAELAAAVAPYEHILLWGTLPAMWMGVQRAYLTALARPQLIMTVSLVALVMNGFPNYGLIHGAFGLPEMGYLGSATAAMITLWWQMIAKHHRHPLHARSAPGEAAGAGAMEAGPGTGCPRLAHLGHNRRGDHVVWRGRTAGEHSRRDAAGGPSDCPYRGVADVHGPPALSQAANVRVGYYISAGTAQSARRAAFVAFALGTGFMVLSALLLVSLPHELALLFGMDRDSAADMAVVNLAAQILLVCAAFQVVDGLQAIAAGSLRGLKATRMPMLLAAISYWGIGFPSAWILGLKLGYGAVGIWTGLAISLAAAAALLLTRFWIMSGRAIAAEKASISSLSLQMV